MLHFTILCVGTVKEKYMREAIGDYAKRLGKYAKLDFMEVPEAVSVRKEGEALLSRIPERAFVVVLDLAGKMLSSPGLAELVEKKAAGGFSHFVFIIGGSEGLDSAVTARAAFRLCMSEMTFPHQMARLILLEQLYRAMKINHGEKYHK